MIDVQLKRNTLFSRVAALLFLIMMFRYRSIFVLLTDPASNIYSIIIVAIFYLLNIMSMVGLFIPKQWGYISSYFAVPLSTFLFAVSYLSFITDWISPSINEYLVPFVNAAFLVYIVTLQVRRRRLLG